MSTLDMIKAALLHLILNPELIAGLLALAWIAFTQHRKATHLGNATAQAADAQLDAKIRGIVASVASLVHSANSGGFLPSGLKPVDAGLQILSSTLQQSGLTVTDEAKALFKLVYAQLSGDLAHVLTGPTLASGAPSQSAQAVAQPSQAVPK